MKIILSWIRKTIQEKVIFEFKARVKIPFSHTIYDPFRCRLGEALGRRYLPWCLFDQRVSFSIHRWGVQVCPRLPEARIADIHFVIFIFRVFEMEFFTSSSQRLSILLLYSSLSLNCIVVGWKIPIPVIEVTWIILYNSRNLNYNQTHPLLPRRVLMRAGHQR